jgi:hypothetical protein
MKNTIVRLSPYFILIAISVFIMGANPFKGETVAPTDILANQAGWQNLAFDVPIRHPARTDILDARLSRWILAKESIRKGENPLWNPNPINGSPGIQWLSASIFTPAFAVFLSIDENATAYYFALLTNLVIACIGSYLFLLALTGNRISSAFGAVVFAFCGFHAAWFYWAHVMTSIWIPWLLFLTLRYLQTQKLKYLPCITIVTSLMIFGGFPSIVVYAFIAVGIMSLFYAPWSEGIKPVLTQAALLTATLALAFLITLFAIQSLSEMLQYTDTFGSRHGGTPLSFKWLAGYIYPYITTYAGVERTIYVGIIPILLAMASLFFLATNKSRTALLFAFVILSLTVSIAFGFLPDWLIKSIPTFNSNNYGRMMILSAVAFSVISAVTLTQLNTIIKNKANTYAALGFTLLLITIQIFDIRALFQNFNGPVPNSTFFPKTPTIEFLQSSHKPLQSIIADRSYQISGIFANYGLPEWFAHGFKTPSEMAILDGEIAPNSHPSPTAAAVHCEGVDFSSDLLTLLGIKYIACNDIDIKGGIESIFFKTKGGHHIASPPIITGAPLVQHFTLTKPALLDMISLQLATHSRETSYTDVTISLYTQDRLVASATVKASDIHDNSWVRFYFGKTVQLDAREHKLAISTAPSPFKGKLSVWLYPRKQESLYVKQANRTINAVVAAKMHLKRTTPPTITEHKIEDNMVLLENTRVKGSGYALSKLDRSESPDFDHVQLIESRGTGYRLKYTGDKPGWLILPVRAYPQWQAYRNDEPINYEKFLGMLPAIPVSSKDVVSYRYEPRTLYQLALLSLVGLLFTVFLCIRWRNR